MSQQVDLHCTFQPSTDKDAEISSALHPLNTVLKNKSRKSPFRNSLVEIPFDLNLVSVITQSHTALQNPSPPLTVASV